MILSYTQAERFTVHSTFLAVQDSRPTMSLLLRSLRLSGSSARVAPYYYCSTSRRTFVASAVTQAKLTVEQLAEKVDLKGQNVLVRVDLNVPLAKVSL